jgi:hypothetical protein
LPASQRSSKQIHPGKRKQAFILADSLFNKKYKESKLKEQQAFIKAERFLALNTKKANSKRTNLHDESSPLFRSTKSIFLKHLFFVQ